MLWSTDQALLPIPNSVFARHGATEQIGSLEGRPHFALAKRNTGDFFACEWVGFF